MVFKSGPHFDPVKRQDFLNFDPVGLSRNIKRKLEGIENDPSVVMLHSLADFGFTDIALGHITGADPVLIDEVQQILVHWAQLSLEREEWRALTYILAEDDSRRRYWGETEAHLPPRPEAWLHANLVLIADHWLRTGTLDRHMITVVLIKDIEGLPAIQGAYSSLDLLPLSAWPEIKMLPALPDEQGLKRKPDAVERIALMLADDPGQLHDPKSPARKRARNYMRSNMSQNWLNQGLAGYAMSWLRTIEWREGQSGLSPREVMLRAYAYMPEVEPPPNIAAEVATLRKLPI